MWLKTDCHTCEELPQEQEVLGSTTGGVTAAQWLFEGPHSSNTMCKWLIIHTFSTSLLPMNNHLECSRGVSVSLTLRCSWDSSPAQPDHIHRRAKHSCKLQLRREHAQLLLSTGTRSHSSTKSRTTTWTLYVQTTLAPVYLHSEAGGFSSLSQKMLLGRSHVTSYSYVNCV